jgi:hypothetical protein
VLTSQRAYYGTAEKKVNGSEMKARAFAEGFSPPLIGWRVFDGKAPAPTLAETTQSKAGVDVASLAAATAKVRTSKGMAAKRVSVRAMTPEHFERPSAQADETAGDFEDMHFVPLIARLLCQAVRNLGGFKQEGIFRKAGSRKDAEAIRELIHKGDYSVLRVKSGDHRRGSSTGSGISTASSLSASSGLGGAAAGGGRGKPRLKDANVAADVLKQWLRAMPEPLIEFKLYRKAVDAGNRKSASEAAAVVWGLCDEHRQTLLFLLKFFWDLMQTEDTTKMGAAQIAIVIMPNIIKSEHLSSNPAMAIMNANAEKDFVKTLLENFASVVKGPM